VAERPSPSGRRSQVGRNAAYNLVGAAAPILVSLVAVPVYLDVVGEVRYGVLVLVWALLGFFGVSDFGIAIATGNHVARVPAGDRDALGRVVVTAAALTAGAGLAAGALFVGVGAILVQLVLDIPAPLHGETYAALAWVSATLPFANLFWVSIGAAEGRERFLEANALRLVAAVMTQALPLVAAWLWEPTLAAIGAGLLASTLVSSAAGMSLAARRLGSPALRLPDRATAASLLRYGSWVTVTGVVSAVVASVDRLVIGAVRGPRAVTQYAIPANLVARLHLVPSSLTRTLFPRFSREADATGDALARTAITALVAIVTPVVVVAMVALEPFLRIWVGAPLAEAGAPVGSILLLGAWIGAIAFVPYSLLLGRRRPDIPDKLVVAELPIYFGLLWAGLSLFGLEGAAWAWSVRVAGDAALLFAFAPRRLVDGRVLLGGAGAVGASYLASVAIFDDPVGRAVVGGALAVAACAWALWVLTSRHLLELRPRATATPRADPPPTR